MSWEEVARKKSDFTPDAGNSPGTPEYIQGPKINVFAGTGSAAAMSYMALVESTFTRPPGTAPAASLSDVYGMDVDDDPATAAAARSALTPEQTEVLDMYNSEGTIDEDTTEPPAAPAAVPPDCAAFAALNPPFSSSLVLSPNFTYGQLSTQVKVRAHTIPAGNKNGLTPQQQLCNLKALCDNVLEPLVARYGRRNIVINSGYRNNGGVSQHEKGQAVDIRFADLPGGRGSGAQKAYYDRAREIRDGFNYDQLLLEVFGNQGPWIHVSYNSASSRRSVLTYFSSSSKKAGLHLLS